MPTILRPPESAVPRHAPDRMRWIGWLAAAACLGGATAVWIYRRPAPAIVVTVPVPVAIPIVEAPPAVADPTPAEARAALLASAHDVVTTEWTATKDAAATGVTGDIVWSNAEQKGFMRFHGAVPNDKIVSVYQLWIFDKDQDARFPIDGGVFDVDANGDVVVPIHAKLHVGQPTLFAVTVERPGGVVVSKRERIIVTATPKPG